MGLMGGTASSPTSDFIQDAAVTSIDSGEETPSHSFAGRNVWCILMTHLFTSGVAVIQSAAQEFSSQCWFKLLLETSAFFFLIRGDKNKDVRASR